MEEKYNQLCDAYALQHNIHKSASNPNVTITYTTVSGIRCSKCKGNYMRQVDEKQLRCADEGSTLFFECKDCLFITRINT